MIKKSRVKVVVFVLIIAIAIFGIGFHLYNHTYGSAAFLVMMVLPIIIKRKELLDRWFGETPV